MMIASEKKRVILVILLQDDHKWMILFDHKYEVAQVQI